MTLKESQMIGKKYGRLTVLCKSHQNKENRWLWLCICECGNKVSRAKNQLENKSFSSCGCYIAKPNLSHGMKYTKEYRTWSGIKDRCLNVKSRHYHNYGGRGISMCTEWANSFQSFFNDMGHPLSEKYQVDRIDNNKGYYKENCRWATCKENTCNTRLSKIWNVKGIVFYSATDAAEHFNVHISTIHAWCKGIKGTIKKTDCNFTERYPI